MIWREEERFRIWAVQMDSSRGLMGIRRMDKAPNDVMRKMGGLCYLCESRTLFTIEATDRMEEGTATLSLSYFF